MRKAVYLFIFFPFFIGGLTIAPLSTQTLQSVELQMSAELQQSLWIMISNETITFRSSDPTYPPSTLPANENPVYISVLARVQGNETTVLQVLANGNLESGENQIPISNVNWKATNIHSPRGTFLDGTMSATEPQLAGQWRTSGWRFGSFNFFYYNDPRPPGNYIQTVTYTLSIQ